MRHQQPARYRLISHPDVPDDLAALSAYGADAVTAARVALDDLAHGRVTGKTLGERHVSGDLTGLASVKFDIPGSPTPTIPTGLRRHRRHPRAVFWPSASVRNTQSIAWPSSGSKFAKKETAPATSSTSARLHSRTVSEARDET